MVNGHIPIPIFAGEGEDWVPGHINSEQGFTFENAKHKVRKICHLSHCHWSLVISFYNVVPTIKSLTFTLRLL